MLKIHAVPNWKLLAPLLALTLLGLFWLPYHVPAPPSVSDSYIFGFNNRVAWLSFLAYMGTLVVFGPTLVEPDGTGENLPRRTLVFALTGMLLASIAMYIAVRPLAGYGEAELFTDRIRLMLQGWKPYLDFEYPYGAGLLYVPVYLARFLHIRPTDAYGLVFVPMSVTGVYILWRSFHWIDGSLQAKRRLFWFLWTASLISVLNFGLNYCWLRFELPVFWMLLIHRSALRTSPKSFLPFALSALGYITMLLISPELAVALAVGSFLYLLLIRGRNLPRNLLSFALLFVVLAGVSTFAFRLGVFKTMLAFRAGGTNFPVPPALHILVFLMAAGTTACVVKGALQTGTMGTAVPLFCYSLLASAAALGRCDPGHVLANGLPLILSGGISLAGMRLPWRTFPLLLWFVFVGPVILDAPLVGEALARAGLPGIFALEHSTHPTRFDALVLQYFQRKAGKQGGTEAFASYRSVLQGQLPLDFPTLFGQPPGTVFQVPFGFVVGRYGRYEAPALDPGYFLVLINIGTPLEVQQKINELRRHPERPVLLLPGQEHACDVDAQVERMDISKLFKFPYRAKAVHEHSLTLPFCNYIQQHYHLALPADAAHFNYALWAPRHEFRPRASTPGSPEVP